jgi:hypothetical protein
MAMAPVQDVTSPVFRAPLTFSPTNARGKTLDVTAKSSKVLTYLPPHVYKENSNESAKSYNGGRWYTNGGKKYGEK